MLFLLCEFGSQMTLFSIGLLLMIYPRFSFVCCYHLRRKLVTKDSIYSKNREIFELRVEDEFENSNFRDYLENVESSNYDQFQLC